MKYRILRFLVIVLFIAGFGLLSYPVVSNQWNTYVQKQLISGYAKSVETMSEADYSEELGQAEAFNNNVVVNDIASDVFSTDAAEEEETSNEYASVLNINNDGIMGYLSIPKINIEYSIYHGTNEEDLQTGLGHLRKTSLPVGGPGTHSVIAGHRGLPTGKLFTDIDQLEPGDKFYIHVLGETLAYEVDQIMPMIEAEDYDTLTKALAIEEGMDYVTLFTCTPYGVNTHRLLVRGRRVEYLGEDEVPTGTDALIEDAKDYYMLYFIAGLIVVLLIVVIFSLISKVRAKNSREESSEI